MGGFACSAKLSKDLDRCSFFIPLAKTLCRLGWFVHCWMLVCVGIFCVCGNQKFKTSVSGSGMARDLEVAFEKTTTTTITLHHDTPSEAAV